MEIKQIIAATVAVIMICLIAIPLIEGTTDFTENAQNTTGMTGNYKKYNNEIIDIAKGNDNNFTINGENVSITTWFYADKFVIALSNTNVTMFDFENNTRVTADSYHFENNALTYDSVTVNFEIMIYTKSGGEYGAIYAYQTPVNIDKTSEMMVVYNNDAAPKACFYGTYDNLQKGYAGVIIGDSITPDESITIQDNLKIVSTPLSGTEKTVTINSLEYLYNSENITNTLTFVPYTYQAPSEPVIKTLINLIPVLLIVAVVIGIAAQFVRK